MGKEMKAREYNRDVFEKALDAAVPVGSAALGGVAARRIGRKLLPYSGETVRDLERLRPDIQKVRGSDLRWIERQMIDNDLQRLPDNLTPQQEKYFLKRIRDADGYGRTGVARGVLTTAGTALGFDAGNELRNRSKRRK